MSITSREPRSPHLLFGLNLIYWQMYADFVRAEFLSLLAEIDDLIDQAVDPRGRDWLTIMKPHIRQGAEVALVQLGAGRRINSDRPLLRLTDVDLTPRKGVGDAVAAYLVPAFEFPDSERHQMDAVIESVIATLLAPLLALSSDTDAAFTEFVRRIRKQWKGRLRPQSYLYPRMLQNHAARAEVLGDLLKVREHWQHCMALMVLAYCGPTATSLLGEAAGTITRADQAIAWGARSDVLVPEEIIAQLAYAIMRWFTQRESVIFPRRR